MFDVFYSGIKPNLFAHEREVDSIEHAQQQSRTRYFWWVNYLTDYTGWDFLWEPVPWESHYTHTWPSQHHEYSGTYLVPKHVNAVEYKFHDRVLPLKVLTDNYKQLVSKIEFDHSWHPHPHDPPFIYVFGNQWWPANKMPTIEYSVPGAVDRKYMDSPRANLLPQPDAPWKTLVECEWDYSWRPDPGDPPYIYVFGNQWWPSVKMPTVEYHALGATERKYMPWPKARLLPCNNYWSIPDGLATDTIDLSWQPDPGDPPYIYQFGTQWQKTGGPTYTMPGATEIKYIPAPRVEKISTDSHWEIPEGADVTTFDWTWHPDATEQPYIYQFGTQHQRTGGPKYQVPGATEVKVKYVDQIRIKTQRVATAIYEIDHMDSNAGHIPNTSKVVRYFDNYLDTLRRLARSIPEEHEFVWICSSVCDYTDFDFSWHPEQWQAAMLHVFASDGEKFGDTFFMHVPTFLLRSEKCQLLEWYDLNFVGTSVPRRPLPVLQHNFDTHVQAVKELKWSGPLAVLTTDSEIEQVPTVSLWREKTKTIVPMAKGASQVIVPKAAVPYIKTQLYDYPHIDRTQRHLHDEPPLDIVFIDNGEPNAEYNWLQLPQTSVPNRIHRSTGVAGRVAAYHAAARLSTTPWFFAVFAKLSVSESFEWSWQPDRMQQPKHYIFHAKNPCNGLIYGHQAMIAYNRELVLNNPGIGLDFTLDSEHEVVPILSGTAEYAHTPWMAWRTAFRECIKLRASQDVESQFRLDKWLTVDMGQLNGEWSIYGAQDAVEYYDAVGGDLSELRKSYDWAWLASYAMIKRGRALDQ
jgi:hypothetical protein